MALPPILVIDDEEAITSTVSNFLSSKGYPVTVIQDGEDALAQVRSKLHPIIICDIYIDQVTGLDILREAKNVNSAAAVILITGRGSVPTTVEAENSGAFEYLAKPFDLHDLLAVVARAAEYIQKFASTPPPGDTEQYGDLIGFSPPMVQVFKQIARAARSEETVLIVGETGVGKELVARAIHAHSSRASMPYVPVDCGAVSMMLWESELFGSLRGAYTGADRDRQGVLAAARGGTVFFDEVGEIPLEFQPKLLRLLQGKEYRPVGAGSPRKADVRFIAATNRDLQVLAQKGEFREDLFHRLNVLRIDVPPLRERRSDIPFLLKKFLNDSTASAQKRIWLEPQAEALLERLDWPGNVRQLDNFMRRLVALSAPGPVSAKDIETALKQETRPTADVEPTELGERERHQILRVLQQTRGNKTRAAEILGIQRRTLYKKLARIQRETGGHGAVPESHK